MNLELKMFARKKYDTLEKIVDKLRDVAYEQFSIKLTDADGNKDFFDELGLDHLDHVEFLMLVESDFGVCITSEEEEKLTTFNKVVEFITKDFNLANAKIPNPPKKSAPKYIGIDFGIGESVSKVVLMKFLADNPDATNIKFVINDARDKVTLQAEIKHPTTKKD